MPNMVLIMDLGVTMGVVSSGVVYACINTIVLSSGVRPWQSVPIHLHFIFHLHCVLLYKVKLALNLADAIICGFWGFMWFVCFCFTADQRRKVVSHEAIGDSAIDCANAGIAFSFFSIIVWVNLRL